MSKNAGKIPTASSVKGIQSRRKSTKSAKLLVENVGIEPEDENSPSPVKNSEKLSISFTPAPAPPPRQKIKARTKSKGRKQGGLVGKILLGSKSGSDRERLPKSIERAVDFEADISKNELSQQLLERQRQYVKNLKLVVNNWVKMPFGKKKGSESASATLFMGIEQIFNFENDFYKALKQKYDQNPEDPAFAEQFNNLFRKVELFLNYSASFEKTLDTYRQLVDDQKWREWNLECKQKSGSELNLCELLLLPLDRLSQFLHFLQKFRAITSLNHKDYGVYSTLELQVKLAVESIAQSKPLEAKMHMFKIYENVVIPEGKSFDLFTPSDRIYLDEGPIDFEGSDHVRRRGHVYLFSDIIVLAEIMTKGHQQFVEVIPTGNIEIRDLMEDSVSEEEPSSAHSHHSPHLTNTPSIPVLNPPSTLPHPLPSSISSPHLSNSSSSHSVQLTPSASSGHALVLLKEYPALRVETGKPGSQLDVTLDVRRDIYKEDFRDKPHFNFIGFDESPESADIADYFVYSVLTDNSDSSSIEHNLRVLKTTKKGYHELSIKVPSSTVDNIEKALVELESGNKHMYHVPTNTFPAEFQNIEIVHTQLIDHFKLGVMMCRPGQVDPKKEMLKNQLETSPDDRFRKFMLEMGKLINLEGWQSFRGDMLKGDAYYTIWKNHEVIYHVAPLMDSEEHRRLIANDIAIVIFMEGDMKSSFSFDPSNLDRIGQVPQLYIIVQLVQSHPESRYRVCCISRKSLAESNPIIPQHSLDGPALKDYILTKVHNSMVQTRYSPPFDKLFYKPRAAALSELATKFPPPPSNIHLIQKAKKFLGNSFATNPHQPPQKPSFSTHCGNCNWLFYCDTTEEASEWIRVFQIHYTDDFEEQPTPSRDIPVKKVSLSLSTPHSMIPVRSALMNAKGRMMRKGEFDGTASNNNSSGTSKIELPVQIDLKAIEGLPSVGMQFMNEFRKFMDDSGDLDIFILYVDIFNFRAAFHLTQEETEREGDTILKLLNVKKANGPSLLERLNLVPLTSKRSNPKMFDGYFIEVQSYVQRSYTKFINNSTNWTLQRQGLLRKRSQSLFTQEHLMRQVPYSFDEGLLAQYPDLVFVYAKYLKSKKCDTQLNFYIQVHKFKRTILTTEKILEQAKNIAHKYSDFMASLDCWSSSKLKLDKDHSQTIFDSLWMEVQGKLNTNYVKFIEEYQVKSTNFEDLREIEKKIH